MRIKLLIVAAFIFIGIKVDAQGQYATFNHVAIMVTNADRSAAFYTKWFHLHIIKNPFPGRPIKWLSLGGSMQLHLIQGQKSEVTVSRDNHIAFSVTSITDFEKLLKKANILYEDEDGKAGAITTRSDGVKQIYFRDPDGYLVEVNNAR